MNQLTLDITQAPNGASGSNAAATQAAESQAQAKPAPANPMRKIILMVGVSILVFLAVTAYSVHKSVQSSSQLSAIKDMYFPVLQKIEANMVRLDKMEELFMRSVMLGEHDPLDEAKDFYGKADQDFLEMAKIYPQRGKDIAKLRQEFKQYNDLAMGNVEAFLAKKAGNVQEQTKHMNLVLNNLRGSIKAFRESSYGNFVATLGESQATVKLNLYMGIALGLMNLCFMGVLVFFIRNNLTMMAVIAEQNATLEKRVAERTSQLRQKTNDIQAMLQNMPQGVLTVLPGGAIHPEYSAYMETIFGTGEIAGRNVMDLVFGNTSLGSNDLSQVDAALGSCIGEDLMNFEFNAHLLVAEFDKTLEDGTVKSLELSWSPICGDNDVVEKLMLCVRDVTELKRLANEAGAQKRELEIIGQILAVSQEKFQDFIESSYKFVAENDALIRGAAGKDADTIGLLFRNMHTIKGNARTYGLLHMTNAVHETEQEYDDLRKDADKVWESEQLLAKLGEVSALLDEYHKINDHTLGRKGPGRRGNVERFLMVDKDQVGRALALIKASEAADTNEVRQALGEVTRILNMIGTEKVDQILSGIVESLPSLAAELGKEAPVVRVADNGIALRVQASGVLKNVFTHLLRNSVDHGLETADVRQAAGKSPAGRIDLAVSLGEGMVRFTLGDDGRGLAVGKIRQKALANGVIAEGDVLSSEAVAQLIFASGFSTAEQVTEVSGRGVGMDAVKGFLNKEGGDVAIRFTAGADGDELRPFELVVTLPEKFAVQG